MMFALYHYIWCLHYINALFYYFSSRYALSYEFMKTWEQERTGCIGSPRRKNNVWTLWHWLWVFAPFARFRPFDHKKKINQRFEPGCQVRALILSNVQNVFDFNSRPLTECGPTNAWWHQNTENLSGARFVFAMSNRKCMHAYEVMWSQDAHSAEVIMELLAMRKQYT